MTEYIEAIQTFINEVFADCRALPDEVIEDAIDEFWDDIPEDVQEITLSHPGIEGAMIIVEIDEDGEIGINRVYANEGDEELDAYYYEDEQGNMDEDAECETEPIACEA